MARLFHLGRDAWCLRISVVDLHRYRPMADVTMRRPFFRSTSPLVGVGCHKIAAYLHGVPCPSDALAGWLLPIAGPIRQLRPCTSKSCCEQHRFSMSVVQHVQGSSVARTPSSRLAIPTCRACSIPTAPLGFFPSEIQPYPEPDTFRLALPFCSLAGRIIPPSSRWPCGDRSDRLDNLPVFTPVAPGCRISWDGRLASRSSFEGRRARRHRAGAAPLAAGRDRVAPADGQNPEGLCIDAQYDGSVQPGSVLIALPRLRRFARHPHGFRWLATAAVAFFAHGCPSTSRKRCLCRHFCHCLCLRSVSLQSCCHGAAVVTLRAGIQGF